MDGCGDGRVLGAYGRGELNNNGKRLIFAKDNKLALTNTLFSTRKGVEYLMHSTASTPAMNKNGLAIS